MSKLLLYKKIIVDLRKMSSKAPLSSRHVNYINSPTLTKNLPFMKKKQYMTFLLIIILYLTCYTKYTLFSKLTPISDGY